MRFANCTFLASVYKTSFVSSLPVGISVSDKLINGTVAGQLLSSLLAVVPITVAINSNMRMVQDKMSGAVNDFMVTPVKRTTLALAYFFGTLAATLIVCYTALALGLIYVAIAGWFMRAVDLILLIVDVFLLALFGTALSSLVAVFLSSQGQMSAISAVVSACYGFLCGAYMPLSQCSQALRNAFMFLPGTYGTSIIRNHTMAGAFAKMQAQGFPVEAVDGIRSSIDCNLSFFGHRVTLAAMYLVLILSILILAAAFVLVNVLKRKRKN